MRKLSIIIALSLLAHLGGCVRTEIKAGDIHFSRISFGYDVQFKSIEYDPTIPKLIIEGYDGQAREALLKALGAIR